jgi:hypothetical protein
VRATALAAVGGLDEGMARPGECGIFTDYELCMRLLPNMGLGALYPRIIKRIKTKHELQRTVKWG